MRSSSAHGRRASFAVVLALCAPVVCAQQAAREPHLGYIYPAGGRQGTVFQITAGGQLLKGASGVHVTGDGVQAKVIGHIPGFRPINGQALKDLKARLEELRDTDSEETASASMRIRGGFSRSAPGRDRAVADLREALLDFAAMKRTGKLGASLESTSATGERAWRRPVKQNANLTSGTKKTADHPLVRNLENMSPAEIEYIATHFLNPSFWNPAKSQTNMQIGEKALIEITIADGAAPGDRELRLATASGLTNPLRFQVGALPEISEQEPNEPGSSEAKTVSLPALFNGQIMPGDVDRFRFSAKQGQKLVIRAQARELIPYLADAVPGWFQATLALYDSAGKEAAFSDDYRFNPDPVVFFEVPADGEYELEIRDALYRGREDFVYRVSAGELPFITSMRPLGGRESVATAAKIGGWNLQSSQVQFNTRPGDAPLRQAALHQNGLVSNAITYAVGRLPECGEIEPNETPDSAPILKLPQIVNGTVAQAGDADLFRFRGKAGEMIVAEVCARRLHSPLDSLLRLTDSSGRVLAMNDDCEDKEAGLLTHHADSYLTATLPRDGMYCVHISDTENHGGPEYAYRLRVSAPQPDFALRVTPSSINVPPSGTVPITVYVLRKDGFNGDIEVAPANMSAEFFLGGSRIPAGKDRVRMTLTAQGALERPVVLRLEGRAQIGGQTISRPVVPAEDMMQAFAYRHLAPSQELMAAAKGATRRRGAPPLKLADPGPVRIPAGGTAQVRLQGPSRALLGQIRFELLDPPKGVTLESVTPMAGGLALLLKAADGAARPGFADNLIVEAFREANSAAGNDGKGQKAKGRVSLGVLPAIPFEVVQR